MDRAERKAAHGVSRRRSGAIGVRTGRSRRWRSVSNTSGRERTGRENTKAPCEPGSNASGELVANPAAAVHTEPFEVGDRSEEGIGRLEVGIEVLDERSVLGSRGPGVTGGSVYERLSFGREAVEPLSKRSETVVASVQFLEPERQEVMIADPRQPVAYRTDPVDRVPERFGLPIERPQHRFRFVPPFACHRLSRRFQFRGKASAGLRSQPRGDGVAEFGPKGRDERLGVGKIFDTARADGFGEPFPNVTAPIVRPTGRVERGSDRRRAPVCADCRLRPPIDGGCLTNGTCELIERGQFLLDVCSFGLDAVERAL